jgi:hypothetical protein
MIQWQASPLRDAALSVQLLPSVTLSQSFLLGVATPVQFVPRVSPAQSNCCPAPRTASHSVRLVAQPVIAAWHVTLLI